MRRIGIAPLLVLLALAASCASGGGGAQNASGAGGGTVGPSSGPQSPPAPPAGPLSVVAGELRDPAGRAIFLRGFNTGNASKSAPYLPWQGEADLDNLRPWGINALRLLISWKALEPRPGRIEQAYLDEIVRFVRRCSDRCIFVLVDMHQDLYAEAVGGNGAPDWAVVRSSSIDTGSFFRQFPWFVGYLKPEVMAAFDAFWLNATVAATGRGLQDHYAECWAAVASRLRGEPYVLGYDIMNEPYYGSDIVQVFIAALRHDPALVLSGALGVLIQGGATGAVPILRDEATVDGFLAGLETPVRAFEELKLMPFYDRVARAIRAVDPEHALVLEGTQLKFAGGRSFIRAPQDFSGLPCQNVVFAQHYYDPSMVDGSLAYDGRRSRAENVMRRSIAEAQAQGAAFLLGEWGALRSTVGRAEDYIADYYDLLADLGVGGLYWAWEPDLAAMPFFGAFARPYASAVAGRLVATSFDRATACLRLSFAADPAIPAETEIYLPAAVYPTYRLVTTDPAGTYSASFDPATRTLRYRTGTAGMVAIELTP